MVKLFGTGSEIDTQDELGRIVEIGVVVARFDVRECFHELAKKLEFRFNGNIIHRDVVDEKLNAGHNR